MARELGGQMYLGIEPQRTRAPIRPSRIFGSIVAVCALITTLSLLVFSSLAFGRATAPPLGAVAKLDTAAVPGGSPYGGGNWASPDALYYYTDSAGNLNVVVHSAAALTIDTYNPASFQRVGAKRSISLAGWPDWGGFYAGPDGSFYVLVGRGNPHENDNLDVVAVRRYDRNWTLRGTAYVQGGADPGGIYWPCQGGAPHMVLVGNRLVVNMGRLIYARGGFVHHQMSFPFEVNVDTMTATPFYQFGVWNYVSHSFQQLVARNGSDLIMIDHGDAYPRAIAMGVIAGYPAQSRLSTYELFEFNGKAGDNFTGATVTSLVSGPSGIVVLGNSIRQPNAPNGPLGSPDEKRNIYAIWADPATGAHTVRWLTSFAPGGADDALEPRVVQVAQDRYAVLFSVRHGSGYPTGLEYRLLDSAGAVLARASFPGMPFSSSSDPILIGHSVYWVDIDPHSSHYPAPKYLFGLGLADPARPTLLAWKWGAPRAKAPRLAATVSRTGRRVSVLVRTAAGARGTIAVSARQGGVRARIRRRGRRYSFNASRSGRWLIVVSFTGARGWKSARVTRTVSVR